MYQATTHDIRVTVEPHFMKDRSMPDMNRYFWSYRIEIVNLGQATVQLRSRYWRITDAHGHVEEVRGPGVVGEEPVLEPGGSYTYTSGCPLSTPSGIMAGSYRMERRDGSTFDIVVPAFSLDSPFERMRAN